MYTEEYENRGFPFRDFLLKLVLVIVFVFLLVWLLPKFITPTVKTSSGTSNKGCTTSTCNTSGINALTSQIFADNLERMKEAAIKYYTDERLPKEVGQSSTMTLSDMIGKKIIVALIDKNNKACDVEKSYVKITKTDDEYILKVNLKDSEKEDYILVHLGCYTYCDSYICQKQGGETPVKGAKTGAYIPVKGSKEKGIYYVEKEVTKVVEVTICGYRNGNYYDKNGNVVSKSEYKKSCGVPEDKHVCVKVDNKYYDKDGNVVSEEAYKESCGIEEKHYCVKIGDKYYGSEGKVVSEETYNKQCNAPKKDYEYEYAKDINAKLSNWSSWSAWSKTSCDTPEINCNESDPACLRKVQRYDRKEQVGTYEKTYAKQRDVIKQTGSYTQKSCSKYNYVVINDITYVTTITTKYTQTNVITSTTRSSQGGWTYVGRQTFTNPPRDTATTHYKFVGADYSYCSDTCTTLPSYYYDVYTYTGGLKTVSSTTTPGDITSNTTTSTTSSIDTSTEANCGEYVYKTIPIYSTITVTEKAKRTEPLYATTCYQSSKTRNIISSAYTKTKWSTYNNKDLLADGWYYTNNKRLK